MIPLALEPGRSGAGRSRRRRSTGASWWRVDHDDCLPLDNVAVAILPKRSMRRRCGARQRGQSVSAKALQANSLVELQVSATLPERYEPEVLYVFHRRAPQDFQVRNAMVIDPIESTSLWQVGESLENPIVTKQDQDSPLMRHVRLDNVLLPERVA